MKKATFVLMFGMAIAAVASMSSIDWKTTTINLGSVSKGELQHLTFEFTNASDQTVNIIDAKGSCGCTNVKYPQDAIAPGESATIQADFRSSKVGAFKKNIKVKTSDKEDYTFLHFQGEIVQ